MPADEHTTRLPTDEAAGIAPVAPATDAPVPPAPTERPDPETMRALQRDAAAPGSVPPPLRPPFIRPTVAEGPGRGPDRRRHRRRVALAVTFVVGLLLIGGFARRGGDSPPIGTTSATPPVAGADDLASDREGGEIDLEVDREGVAPGFALGDEAGGGVGDLGGTDIPDGWPVPGGRAPGSGSGSGSGSGPGSGSGTLDPAPPPPDPQPDGDDAEEPSTDDEPGGGDAPDPGPADPCAGIAPDAHLVTTPDPKQLIPGTMTSTVTIRNCGADPVAWTAATKPSVSLSAEIGAVVGGAEQALGFTIDPSAFPDAAIAFTIKISEPGFNQYVDISATKAGLADAGAASPDPGGTITTGGPDGCAASCITTAWLTPNATTPNLGLEVATSTPARIGVFVSTSAPVAGPDGQPTFPEGGLIAATNDLDVAWTTLLSPLDAATDYHIVVRATDADGGVSNRVGTFRTTTPAVDPGLDAAAPGGDAGCATQCITKAWLTPDPSSFDVGLEVTSHTLARFEAYLSTEAPTLDAEDHPVFAGAAPTTTNFAYEMAWTTPFEQLEPATRYHVIVKATDGMFRSSYQVGSFETRAGANELLVSFHQVRVHDDGDAHGKGELRFRFYVGDQTVATTEWDRIGSGTTLNLSDGDRWPGLSTSVDIDPSPSAFLPVLYGTAFERDRDGLVEFCDRGERQTVPGHEDGCDLKWDVARSDPMRSGAIESLPSCPELGIDAAEMAAAHCLQLDSPGNGDDYPRFSVIVSVQAITV